MSLRLRPMEVEHLPQVLAIEARAFPSPWSEASFRGEMQRGSFSHAWVLESPEGGVAGYIFYWILYEDLHINNVAVAPEWQGRGLGTRLVKLALERGESAGCARARLEVRPSNAGALALYRKLGFSSGGRRARYYNDSGEDALLLGRALARP